MPRLENIKHGVYMNYIVKRLHDDRIMLKCGSKQRAKAMMDMMRRSGTMSYLESVKLQVMAS